MEASHGAQCGDGPRSRPHSLLVRAIWALMSGNYQRSVQANTKSNRGPRAPSLPYPWARHGTLMLRANAPRERL